jgi:hypothetical protein
MSIDPEADTLIAIAAVKALQENYAHLAPWKLIRWHKRGIWSTEGNLVNLDLISIGGRWFTTKKALREFFDKCGGRV